MSRKRNYRSDFNRLVDTAYAIQSFARIIAGIVVGVGAVIGALAGLGLSFTALSPLVAGGIIGVVSPALLALVAIGLRRFYCDEINKFKKEEGIVEKDVIAAFVPPLFLATIASVAVGVGLAATANVIFLVSLQLGGQ